MNNEVCIKYNNSGKNLFIFFIGLLVFLFVCAARIIVINYFAVNIPTEDQWGGEISNLYLPYLQNKLLFKSLFVAHNEHRIFFTRVLNLLAFIIHGSYSPILVMKLQTIVWALIAFLFTIWNVKDRNEINYYSLALIAAIFALPIGFTNLLWSFQSQFYFMILFSMIAIRLASTPNISFGKVIAINIFCLCAFFSSAGGIFTSLISAITVIYFGFNSKKNRVKYWFVALMLFGMFCIMLKLSPIPAHEEYLVAKTIGHFLSSFWKSIIWPYNIFSWLNPYNHKFINLIVKCLSIIIGFLIIALPTIILYKGLIKKELNVSEYIFPLAIYGWVSLQYIAMSYARGGINGRYSEIALISIVAMLFLLDAYRSYTNAKELGLAQINKAYLGMQRDISGAELKANSVLQYVVYFTNKIKVLMIVFLISFTFYYSLRGLLADKQVKVQAFYLIKGTIGLIDNNQYELAKHKLIANSNKLCANSEEVWRLINDVIVRNRILPLSIRE